MKKIFSVAVAAFALTSLAACENKVEEVDSRAPDPMASQLANAAPVEPPPSISETVTFRCQPGNTLVGVDFFVGDKMVNLKLDPAAPVGTTLKAENAGDPYTADGYTVTGNPKAVTIVKPDGEKLSCKA